MLSSGLLSSEFPTRKPLPPRPACAATDEKTRAALMEHIGSFEHFGMLVAGSWHAACAEADVTALQALLQKQPQRAADADPISGATPLHVAVVKGRSGLAHAQSWM